MNPDSTRSQAADGHTPTFDPALDAGLAAAFGSSDLSETLPRDGHGLAPGSGGADRYVLGDEIARGGMGVVLRATDTTLGREVAVKVLSGRFGPDSAAARRFADEARITSRLQHPAIPPVHDLGTLPDGRPFLAMKLIEGQTLDALLSARPATTADRGRFVAAFEGVCQAVAYAHSRGVIHRDLKPSNVMVGSFGEVQVMDWGLAKVLANCDGGQPPGGTGDSPGDGQTNAGTILGTPAHMAPEQARGEPADRRSDVFGLGAVLCAILTGHPPFGGPGDSALRRAAGGDVAEAFAQLDGCDTDPELITLCKRCLAPDPADRPADAAEVAAAVAGLRAAADDRARRAELDRAEAATEAREQRKRRKVQLALAVAVGLLVVGGGAFAWWQDRQASDRRRTREVAAAAARQVVETALTRTEGALAAGAIPDADAALARADEALTGLDAPDLWYRHSALTRDRDLARDLESIAEERWMVSRSDTRYDPTRPKRRYPEAFRRYGLRIGEEPADATTARIRQSAVAEAILAGLDDWFFQDPARPGLRAVLEAADPDPFRSDVRSAVAANNRLLLQQLSAKADGAALPLRFAITLGLEGDVENPSWSRESLRLLKAAWSAHPTSYPLAMAICIRYFVFNCGDLGEEEDRHEMPGWCRIAIALRPSSALAYYYLARTHDSFNPHPSSIAALRHAIRLAPQFAKAQSHLAWLLWHKERKAETPDWSEPLSLARAALTLDPENVEARVVQWHCRYQMGDWTGAATEYVRALAADRQAVEHGKDMYVSGCDDASAAGFLSGASGAFLANLIQKAGPRVAYELHKENIRVGGSRRDDFWTSRTYRVGVTAAILLGTGDGQDPPPADRPAYLRDARDWLALELTALTRRIAEPHYNRWSAHGIMNSWLAEPRFAAVRDPDRFAALPPDEQAAWVKLWADVRQFRAVTAPEPAPPPREVIR